MLLFTTLFVGINIHVEAAPGGDVSISNVSPVNNSIAIEIVGNPPENSGYANLSFTLTDADAGNDAEFYLNTSTDGVTYTNRLHQILVGDGEYHQHEDTHNHTRTVYYWSVAYRDGSEAFKTEFFSYRTEAKPNRSDTPSPANGSMVLKGNISLSCVVHHPDGVLAPPINVSFHKFPSGDVIGYDNSSLSDGDTAHCDTEYYLHYNGTRYYWYAVAHDDEFSNTSSAWYVQTWYNDTEPNVIWYSTGGDIWVEETYSDTEPSAAWYTLGGRISLYQDVTFNNPIPADDATNQNLILNLVLDVNSTTPKELDWKMRPTANGSSFQCNFSGDTDNWNCVDEVSSDAESTIVYTDNTVAFEEDLYVLNNHTVEQHGDQLNVTVFVNCTNNSGCGNSEAGTARAALRTGGTIYYDPSPVTLTSEWVESNYTWDLNPKTGVEWTWEDIDNLEAGVSILGGNCTQVYVNVHYRQDVSLLTTQFYGNDTVDGSWVQIGTDIAEQRTNYTVSMPFSGLQYNHDYWWRVRVFNTTLGFEKNSSDYHFTTKSPAPEPNVIWYSTGGDIWVEETYSDTEPGTIWYTLGGNITLYFTISLVNESPASGNYSLWRDLVLSCFAQKGGDPTEYEFAFYINDTYDGSWALQGVNQTFDIPGNKTISLPLSGLEYNKTYYWKVIATSFADTQESEVWYFTTNYTITSQDTIWYSMGGDIWVEEEYTDSEPPVVWYTLGGKVIVGAPYKPVDPNPQNNTQLGKHLYPEFSCYVEDPQNYQMNVSFYWGDDTLIGTDTYVESGTRASVPVGWLTNYTWYTWYAVANNSPNASPGVDTESDLWYYKPGNNKPNVTISPEEGDAHVPVRRQIVGGVYRNFVRLTWTLHDNESDIMEFNCFIDDPDIGNWNDWISRWHIYDAQNGSYRQDELEFDLPLTDYHWKLFVSDAYNETTYYANFTTAFYFWSMFNFTPYRSTNNDTVLFIDESQNATSYWWYINSVLVANASGLDASDKFNMTYKFNISNVYNVTQTIYNESADVYDSMTRYIYIDRNVSLNRSSLSAITFHGQSPKDNMKISELCTLLGISSNAWVHMYNTTTSQWVSYWVDNPSITTDFDISLWDSFAFAVADDVNQRINITDSPDQRESYFSRTAALSNTSNATQILTLPAGLNYVCWSNISQTVPSSSVVSIGLDTEDAIYLYNTSTDIWDSYLVGSGGTDFEIKAYTIIVFDLAESRIITIEDGF